MAAEIFTRVSPTRTADEVCAQVEDLILEGVLRVGDQLPGERDLSEKLGISRPVLRAALEQLVERGLLTRQHGGGTFVADVIGHVFSKTMLELIASHPKATTDYIEYRRDVEGIAAGYAAQRATDDDKALLADIMDRMRSAHADDDYKEEAAIDVEFHQAICESAHNVILLHTMRSCYRLLSNGAFFSRSLVYDFPGAPDKLLEQHTNIYNAVIAGDAAEATAAARAHMDFVESCKQEAERADAWQSVSRLKRIQRIGVR